MIRIRQQHWFCLAAVSLVGSLLTIWSIEIPVAEEETSLSAGLMERPVLRRLSDLPESSSLLPSPAGPAPRERPSGASVSGDVLIQAPAGVAGRTASPLNTTGRVIPREGIAPAAFQQIAAVMSEPVRLTGQIEPIDSAFKGF